MADPSKNKRLAIRAGMGIGDGLYLQSVVRHFVEQGHLVEACCAWPDLFRPLGDKVVVSPFRRDRIDRLAHYTTRKQLRGTTQFEDCCINAGIREQVDFRLDWVPQTPRWRDELGTDLPVILVQMPRPPFGRKDGFGKEVLPDCRVIQRAIDLLAGRARIVQVGAGEPLFKFSGIDVDLVGKTSVADLLDVAHAANGFLGYCSFFVPLSESFSKPSLFVWSRRGLNCRTPFVSSIKPGKILHRPSSRFVVDDCTETELGRAVNALFDAARG
jgi:hypothetical protein